MPKNGQLPVSSFRRYAKEQQSFRIFLSALAIVASVRTIPILLAKARGRKDQGRKDHRTWTSVVDESAIRIALFPTLLPRVYRYLRDRFGSPGSAELLSSTLLAFLPPSWRIHVVLYAVSSALYHTGTSSRWRRFLPPTWTLNVVGNAYLLWAFLFKSEVFPRAYERVILSNSTHYVPPNMQKAELEDILQNSTFSETPVDASNPKGEHKYELCAKLHPQEPSCLKNYLLACLNESLKTSWWVGAFSALSFILSKRSMISKKPILALRGWLTATLRGTVFVAASITTSWAMTCLLQRVLPKDCLRKTRWLINASIASLWILVLPDKRRNELSLYVARLAALCAWRAWRLDGGMSIPFGDIALFALSWLQLVRLSKKGEKISGLVGLAMAKVQ